MNSSLTYTLCVCVCMCHIVVVIFVVFFFKWQQCITHIFTSPSLHSAAASSSFCSEVPFVVCVWTKTKTHSNSRYINNKTEPNNTYFDYTIVRVRAVGDIGVESGVCVCVCLIHIYFIWTKVYFLSLVVCCGFCSDRLNYRRLLEIHWHSYNLIRNPIGNDISDIY